MKNKYHLGKKTLWEKEKLLVPSNFAFSHNVFHSYISLVHQNAVLCGNGLSRKKILNMHLQTYRIVKLYWIMIWVILYEKGAECICRMYWTVSPCAGWDGHNFWAPAIRMFSGVYWNQLVHVSMFLWAYSFRHSEYSECVLGQWNISEQCAVFFRTCSGYSK